MSDVIPYPINFETKGITGRDGYTVAEALYFATKWIDRQSATVIRPAQHFANIECRLSGSGRCFRTRLENLQIVQL